MRILNQLTPAALQRIRKQARTLTRFGLPPSLIWQQPIRRALWATQIDLLPTGALRGLHTIVDVGANVGDWSIGMARLTGVPKLIAYEPLPAIFEKLEANCRPFPQIDCRRAAVGDSQRPVEINVFQTHQLSSVLELDALARDVHGLQQDQGQKITVQQTTLDDELEEMGEISILKLDVQGYEPQVLAGGARTLQKTKILVTEVTYAPYYRGDLQFAAYDQLITSMAPLHLWNLSEPHRAASGRAMWADAVYVHESLLSER